MSILRIVKVPDPILKEISKEVTFFDKKLERLAINMLETMYHNDGIGLAAVQVGVLKRLIVMDLREENKENDPFVFVNPTFTVLKEKEKACITEGCLSVPKRRILIERPQHILLKYQNLDGSHAELFASGLMAVCIQHEIDHLNGITILDKNDE